MSLKTERIASNLVKEISYILATKIKDRDIRFVTVTDCKVTTDLRYAKVFVSIFGKDDEEKNNTFIALKNASGYIRRELAERVDIRHIPELQFVFDESIEYGNKIEHIIEQIHDKDEN